MKSVIFFIALSSICFNASAYYVCKEGINKYGRWEPCLEGKYVPGAGPQGRGDVGTPYDGQPERIDKHIDGSVSVWITGNPVPQEWKPDGKDSWVRTR